MVAVALAAGGFGGMYGDPEPATTDASGAAGVTSPTGSGGPQPSEREDGATPLDIQLTVGGSTLPGSLEDTAAGRDLASLLPLRLTLSDFHRAERVADLPRRLDIAGAPSGTSVVAGDIAYYAPWGNLALFYEDAPHAEGLVRLGRLDDTAVRVLAALPDAATVTIRRAEDPGS